MTKERISELRESNLSDGEILIPAMAECLDEIDRLQKLVKELERQVDRLETGAVDQNV